MTQPWRSSHRADPEVLPLADRHYNRQKIGTPQFVPPGRCVVLKAVGAGRAVGAFWVTSWPFAEYVKHRWPGAWINSAFRREDRSLGIASNLIRAAVAATRSFWEPPALGLVTFINRKFVKPTKVRGHEVWGYSYLRSGFRYVGETEGGLLALQMLPADMPEAVEPFDAQGVLAFGGAH